MGGVSGDPGRGAPERVGVVSTTGSGSVTTRRTVFQNKFYLVDKFY